MSAATTTLATRHLEHLKSSANDGDIIDARGNRTITGSELGRALCEDL